MSKSKLHDRIMRNVPSAEPVADGNVEEHLRPTTADGNVPPIPVLRTVVGVADQAVPMVIRPDVIWRCPSMPEFSKLRPATEDVFCPHCGFRMVRDKTS